MKSLHFRGKPVSDDQSRVCVLFEPKSGRIIHVHGVTTLRKERSCTKQQLEERAFHNAKIFGRAVEGLKALHVPISAIRQPGALRVDEKGTKVIATSQRPSRKELRATHQARAAKSK
jgi:hypothetical protein